MAEELTFRLEDFEGPLELLLTLVQKHKMDLHNIPILELIDQYTRAVESAESTDPEISSAFIEMAAHLVEMKSYLLLPRSEEGERMKQELTGQLIEYDQCRQMAARLRERGEEYTVFVRTPARLEWDNTYDLFHSPQVRAAGVGSAGLGEQPGGLHPAPAHCRRCKKDGPAVFPPPDPGGQCGHLSGAAGAGARRPCDAWPGGRAEDAPGTH